MSTPINQITENNTNDEMLQDDNNHIVSEILQEMHTNNNNNQKQYEEENDTEYVQEPSFVDNQQQMYQQSQQHQLQRQFDPLVNMPVQDSMHQHQQQQQYNQVQDIQMDYSNRYREKSLKEKIIDKLKDPGIVLFCTFILNNLFTNMLLLKYLPQRFTNMASKVNIMAGDIVKAILVALLFFAFKTIL